MVLTSLKLHLDSYLQKSKYSRLSITTIYQLEMGIIDEKGRILFSSPNSLYEVPNGTGDLLARLQEEGML